MREVYNCLRALECGLGEFERRCRVRTAGIRACLWNFSLRGEVVIVKARAMLAAVLALSILGLFFFPANAHAYLDPGTGSYVLQLLAAAIFGILLAIRLFWSRIKSFLRRLFSKH